jgi:single-strand DNA-binding protein
MANLNRVLLIGRLTRDPESRTTKGGSTLVTFSLAVNRTYYRGGGEGGERGEKVEETCFVDVEAWGRQADTLARYTRKGKSLFVEGRLRQDTWEKDGQRRSKLVVVCENFQFLDSASGSGGGGSGERSGDRSNSYGGGGNAHSAEPVGSRSSRSEPARAEGGETTPQDDYADPVADDIPF